MLTIPCVVMITNNSLLSIVTEINEHSVVTDHVIHWDALFKPYVDAVKCSYKPTSPTVLPQYISA